MSNSYDNAFATVCCIGLNSAVFILIFAIDLGIVSKALFRASIYMSNVKVALSMIF